LDAALESLALPALVATAAATGGIHTLIGPDHYVPFIAMARVGRWTFQRTLIVTLLCGIGHVLSSVVLGLAGIGAGSAVQRLTGIEVTRGEFAGWLLLGFGLMYLIWGIRRGWRNRPHSHFHAHASGEVHAHAHTHAGAHAHPHAESERAARSLTPWVLFTIFVFGPCEPLIPIMFAAHAKLTGWGAGLVALVFSATTIATMTAIVVAGYFGLARLSWGPMQRYGHALAGLAIVACGALMKFGL